MSVSAEGEGSAEQKAWREKFRQAVAYAEGAKDKPEYKAKAESRHLSTFNVATADFLHPPTITEIKLDEYEGKEGNPIFVRAIDDVQVTQVGIIITTDQNVVVEKGKLVREPTDKTLWKYVAGKNAGVSHVKIVVDAADLAGHVTGKMADKTL